MLPVPELPPELRVRAMAHRGLYFEDIREGDWVDSAEAHVDEAAVITFAKAWDPQPFHTDKEAAAGSLFGGLSASGLQTMLLSYKLYVDLEMFAGTALAGLGIDDVLFKAPLRPGDRIRVRAEIASARRSASNPARAVVCLILSTFNQVGDQIASMRLNLLLACRTPG